MVKELCTYWQSVLICNTAYIRTHYCYLVCGDPGHKKEYIANPQISLFYFSIYSSFLTRFQQHFMQISQELYTYQVDTIPFSFAVGLTRDRKT